MTEAIIIFPEKIAVIEEKKSKVKTVAAPFDFPTGVKGILTLTHLNKGDWSPAQEIEKVIIYFV